MPTNTKERGNVGTLAARPAAGKRKGELYISEADLSAWNGTAWVGGSSTALSTKYWVAPAGTTPSLGYTTITAAIAAAAADGHSANNPATIMIMPGTYTENVAMKNGISLFGCGSNRTVNITGNITGAAVDAGTCAISNISVTGQINFSIATMSGVTLSLTNCGATSSANGAHALSLSGDGLSIVATNCSFEAGDTARGITSDGAVNGTFSYCDIRGNAAYAVRISGETWEFTACRFRPGDGQPAIHCNATVTLRVLSGCAFEMQGAPARYIAIDGGGGHTITLTGPVTFYGPVTTAICQGAMTVRGQVDFGAQTVAVLEASQSVGLTLDGATLTAFATNGCKPNEVTGAGTGVPVFYDSDGVSFAWRTYQSVVCGSTFIPLGNEAVVVNDDRITAAASCSAMLSDALADATLTAIVRVTPDVGSLTITGNGVADGNPNVMWSAIVGNMPVID
jgi:hypothetical protein